MFDITKTHYCIARSGSLPTNQDIGPVPVVFSQCQERMFIAEFGSALIRKFLIHQKLFNHQITYLSGANIQLWGNVNDQNSGVMEQLKNLFLEAMIHKNSCERFSPDQTYAEIAILEFLQTLGFVDLLHIHTQWFYTEWLALQVHSGLYNRVRKMFVEAFISGDIFDHHQIWAQSASFTTGMLCTCMYWCFSFDEHDPINPCQTFLAGKKRRQCVWYNRQEFSCTTECFPHQTLPGHKHIKGNLCLFCKSRKSPSLRQSVTWE